MVDQSSLPDHENVLLMFGLFSYQPYNLKDAYYARSLVAIA